MAQESTLSRASAMGTIISVPGSIVSFFKDAPIGLTYSLAGVAVLSVTVFAIYSRNFFRKPLPNLLPNLFKGSNSKYKDDWDTVAHTTEVTILSEDAKSARYCCNTTIKCLRHSANEYYCRLGPTSNFSNISVSGGVISSIKDNAGSWDVIVQLDTPCTVGEKRNLEVRADVTGIFPNMDGEFWEVQKYYGGECSYKINVIFHPKNSFKTCDSKIVIKEDRNNTKKTKFVVKKDIRNGCPVLLADSDELNDSDVLHLCWTW